jgi:hypothetical protein
MIHRISSSNALFHRIAKYWLAAGLVFPVFAKDNVVDKNVTVITAGSQADGSSELRRETISDCLLNLPDPISLEPSVTSESVYLKGINGEAGKDEWKKVYSARLELNYLQYQKALLIVSQRSVQGQPPVMKEIEKTLRQQQVFESNATEGDIFAGRSKREYYFTTQDGAIQDVKKRAKIWVAQQKSVLCPDRK